MFEFTSVDCVTVFNIPNEGNNIAGVVCIRCAHSSSRGNLEKKIEFETQKVFFCKSAKAIYKKNNDYLCIEAE